MEEYKTILKKTDGGLDIFSYYLGKECLKKKFKSPFRSGDNRPSCHLYLNEPPGDKPTTISRTLATADVAATPLQSLQGC